jgi:hypothetical protein
LNDFNQRNVIGASGSEFRRVGDLVEKIEGFLGKIDRPEKELDFFKRLEFFEILRKKIFYLFKYFLLNSFSKLRSTPISNS